MKKIIIILAVILTSGLTALALTNNEKKTEVAKMSSEKPVLANSTSNLATAD